MNDEINESFILSIDENEYYLKKPFLSKLFNYYNQNGYFNLISNQIINILTSIFLVFYSLVLINCINWHKLLKIDDNPINPIFKSFVLIIV